MYLKKNSIIYIIIIIFFFHKNVSADENINDKAINYLSKLKFFSAEFIQDDNETVSQGTLYIGEKRIRIEYNIPSKILIILDENKAMYFNYDLEEDEFFNPQNTHASFFFEIFNNLEFFSDSIAISENSYLILEKIGHNELGKYSIKVFFENNPLLIRKIEVISEEISLVLSIFNHSYNENFGANFFKLINPSFFK